MYAKILISIINYRTCDLTIQCIQSVLDDLTGIDGQVVVVDNASGDGSADQIESWINASRQTSKVQLIRSEINSGFSGGHNQGIAAGMAEYYLILNSDAVIRPGFIAEILNTADQKSGVGLIAPRIEYDDGECQVSCFRFHTPFSELIRGARSGPVSRILKKFVVALDMPPAPEDIEWASFACILLRGDMIRAVGPMDEGYFLYFEDVEYCWRARKAGWGIVYAPQAVAVHFRGGSGPVKALASARKRLPGYFYASRSRMFCQFYGHLGLLIANLCWISGRGFAWLRVLFGKPVPQANSFEARDIWINFLSPMRKAPSRKD